MEIYAALQADHRVIKKILKKLEKTSERQPAERGALLTQLKEVLVPHARAEERVLYDRLKKSAVKEADHVAFEGYEEHAVVDWLMEEIECTSPRDKRWTALITVAKENLEHHIEEEEEELFKKAKKSFDRQAAREMCDEFLELKGDFLSQLRKGNVPFQRPSHEMVAVA